MAKSPSWSGSPPRCEISSLHELHGTDQAFTLSPGVWNIIVGGCLIAAEFPDKGSALAGIEVERRRQAKRTFIDGKTQFGPWLKVEG